MSETYPPDAQLLSLDQDPATGVDYIPTGASPYHLHYRRSLSRLLRATERANDLRVYHAGDRTIGVRPGRCFIGQQSVDHHDDQTLTLPASTISHVWIDAAGSIQHDPAGFPDDRATFIPLARVTTHDTAVQTIEDRRGEAFLQAPSPALLGLTASADEINRALDGIADSVDALALTALTAGPDFPADTLHTHHLLSRDSTGTATFFLRNNSTSDQANLELQFAVPNRFDHPTWLRLNPDHHYFDQVYHQTALTLVGSAQLTHLHVGPLDQSLTDLPLSVVPLDGEVADVVLTVGNALQSSDPADQIAAHVRVNANALTTTPPSLSAADAAGFRCTDRGDGTPGQVDPAATTVRRGDLMTLDLTRTVNGTVAQEARDVGVLVTLRATRPI